jgi:hypothetical protein
MNTWRDIVSSPCPCGGCSEECLECEAGRLMPRWYYEWMHCASAQVESAVDPFVEDLDRLQRQAKRLIDLMPAKRVHIEQDFARAVREVDALAGAEVDRIDREEFAKKRRRK